MKQERYRVWRRRRRLELVRLSCSGIGHLIARTNDVLAVHVQQADPRTLQAALPKALESNTMENVSDGPYNGILVGAASGCAHITRCAGSIMRGNGDRSKMCICRSSMQFTVKAKVVILYS